MNNAKPAMPNRERFMAICRGERDGDVSLIDWFHRSWLETIDNWIEEGAPPEITNQDAYNEYFGLDHLHGLQEIISEHNRADLKELDTQSLVSVHVTPPIMPVFPIEIISEDERHRVETTYGGVTVEVNKQHPWRMPKFVDRPVKDWATWKEYKKRLDPDTPERYPADWAAYVERMNATDAPTMLLLEGYFGPLREWTGLEELIYLFYDEPDLVEDMMDQVLHLSLTMAKRVLKDLRIDCVRFWEDMAYRSGPLISPEMFKKFMTPRYQVITDYLRGEGIEILHVDSDGDATELIPLWLEVGVNFPWPLEVAAGMDAIALRKEYGRELILSGNIDKRVFLEGKDAIRHEVMSKVPYLMETGSYFPCLDHAVPPDVKLDDFRYYVNLLRDIGGLDKLPE